MSVYQTAVKVKTKGFTDIVDVTGLIEAVVSKSPVKDGVINVFVPGSTAALTTVEYEAGVLNDLKKAVERLIPAGIHYDHDARWGDGNGYSHVRAALVGPSICLPVSKNRLVRGTWQQVVFIDFDNCERERSLVVTVIGE